MQPSTFENRKNEVLFVGTLSWYANEEGLTWYIDHIVGNTPKEIHHQIIGGGASDKLLHSLKKHINLTARGYVNDLEPFYQTAKCLVAPLLSGSGVKIKIINSLARGLPVVTTRMGIEGFPAGFQNAILVANSPKEFSEYISRLVYDRNAWEKASKHALTYFNTYFLGASWQQWAKELIP